MDQDILQAIFNAHDTLESIEEKLDKLIELLSNK